MNQCRKMGMRMVSLLLAVAMLFTMQGVSVRAEEGVAGEGAERKVPENPVHHCTGKDDGSDTTDWSSVYFGSYPQTEVIEDDLTEEITGAAYDGNGDAWVDGAKYRRISKSDTNNPDYFGYSMYRYFKWERIKWRVLSNDGSTLFVAADRGLDCKDYNEEYTSVTWENCTLRSWLNSSFYSTAFSSAEQGAIVSQDVVNGDNPDYGTEGGNNTTDNVYLLSIGEVTNPAYGFCETDSTYSASRCLKASDYAHARRTWEDTSSAYAGNSWWWLRSPGSYAYNAVGVPDNGYVDSYGRNVDTHNDAVVPALHINLSSDLWSLADDGDSGEGGDDGTGGSVTPDNGKPDDGKPDDGKPGNGNSNNGNVTVAKTSISGLQADPMGFTVRRQPQATRCSIPPTRNLRQELRRRQSINHLLPS